MRNRRGKVTSLYLTKHHIVMYGGSGFAPATAGRTSHIQRGLKLTIQLVGCNWDTAEHVLPQHKLRNTCSHEAYCRPTNFSRDRFITGYAGKIHKSVPVTTAWRVLRLRMEERPPDMEGSCEYVE
jgi:hypothetical protein